MLPPCRQAQGKKEKGDLDLIERILDVSEEKGQVCVKFRGGCWSFRSRSPMRLWSQTALMRASSHSRLCQLSESHLQLAWESGASCGALFLSANAGLRDCS